MTYNVLGKLCSPTLAPGVGDTVSFTVFATEDIHTLNYTVTCS